jgi:hypothetical protein
MGNRRMRRTGFAEGGEVEDTYVTGDQLAQQVEDRFAQTLETDEKLRHGYAEGGSVKNDYNPIIDDTPVSEGGSTPKTQAESYAKLIRLGKERGESKEQNKQRSAASVDKLSRMPSFPHWNPGDEGNYPGYAEGGEVDVDPMEAERLRQAEEARAAEEARQAEVAAEAARQAEASRQPAAREPEPARSSEPLAQQAGIDDIGQQPTGYKAPNEDLGLTPQDMRTGYDQQAMPQQPQAEERSPVGRVLDHVRSWFDMSAQAAEPTTGYTPAIAPPTAPVTPTTPAPEDRGFFDLAGGAIKKALAGPKAPDVPYEDKSVFDKSLSEIGGDIANVPGNIKRGLAEYVRGDGARPLEEMLSIVTRDPTGKSLNRDVQKTFDEYYSRGDMDRSGQLLQGLRPGVTGMHAQGVAALDQGKLEHAIPLLKRSHDLLPNGEELNIARGNDGNFVVSFRPDPGKAGTPKDYNLTPQQFYSWAKSGAWQFDNMGEKGLRGSLDLLTAPPERRSYRPDPIAAPGQPGAQITPAYPLTMREVEREMEGLTPLQRRNWMPTGGGYISPEIHREMEKRGDPLPFTDSIGQTRRKLAETSADETAIAEQTRARSAAAAANPNSPRGVYRDTAGNTYDTRALNVEGGKASPVAYLGSDPALTRRGADATPARPTVLSDGRVVQTATPDNRRIITDRAGNRYYAPANDPNTGNPPVAPAGTGYASGYEGEGTGVNPAEVAMSRKPTTEQLVRGMRNPTGYSQTPGSMPGKSILDVDRLADERTAYRKSMYPSDDVSRAAADRFQQKVSPQFPEAQRVRTMEASDAAERRFREQGPPPVADPYGVRDRKSQDQVRHDRQLELVGAKNAWHETPEQRQLRERENATIRAQGGVDRENVRGQAGLEREGMRQTGATGRTVMQQEGANYRVGEQQGGQDRRAAAHEAGLDKRAENVLAQRNEHLAYLQSKAFNDRLSREYSSEMQQRMMTVREKVRNGEKLTPSEMENYQIVLDQGLDRSRPDSSIGGGAGSILPRVGRALGIENSAENPPRPAAQGKRWYRSMSTGEWFER